jgi:hypothetical protein
MTEWPDVSQFDMPDAQPWDRMVGEPTKAYAAFRKFRDLPPSQRGGVATIGEAAGFSERRCRQLAIEWMWHERTEAWDDACHRIEDTERLDAIRQMHANHRRAGRAAMMKAVQALQALNPETMGPAHIARLMELGARLERNTLLSSVEELQGIEVEADDDGDDPWERIAAELDPHNAADPDL